MPELPEVETTVRGLRKRVVGRIITAFWCDWPNIIRYISPTKLKKLVVGRKILATKRRAKNILIDLSGGKTLVIHMKMTGHLLYGKWQMSDVKGGSKRWEAVGSGPLRDDPYNRFIHAVFSLNNGYHIAFCDMRKFGKIAIHDTHNLHKAKELENLGPELWELGPSKFLTIYQYITYGTIKQKLLEQKLLAGVGNIYADESLWLAGIHPLSNPGKISKIKLLILFRALVQITKSSLATGGDSMSDYRNVEGKAGKHQNFHKAYKQTGKACQKRGCSGIIMRIAVSSRGTHYCPKHQTLYV